MPTEPGGSPLSGAACATLTVYYKLSPSFPLPTVITESAFFFFSHGVNEATGEIISGDVSTLRSQKEIEREALGVSRLNIAFGEEAKCFHLV